MLPFLSLVTESELMRNPTVKAEQEASGHALTGLLLTYPVHQACDILFCKGNIVPVGKDQLPHIEITRQIARRFNERYAPVFPEPHGLLTEAVEIPGLDGRKMSKSYGNAISLSATAEETAKLINETRAAGHRVIAVGTTSCRTLESVWAKYGKIVPCSGNTSIFIYPGVELKAIDGLITNFHLPESTLIMLIAAFYGYDKTMAAYKVAVEEKYRFFSFGDAMFIR